LFVFILCASVLLIRFFVLIFSLIIYVSFLIYVKRNFTLYIRRMVKRKNLYYAIYNFWDFVLSFTIFCPYFLIYIIFCSNLFIYFFLLFYIFHRIQGNHGEREFTIIVVFGMRYDNFLVYVINSLIFFFQCNVYC